MSINTSVNTSVNTMAYCKVANCCESVCTYHTNATVCMAHCTAYLYHCSFPNCPLLVCAWHPNAQTCRTHCTSPGAHCTKAGCKRDLCHCHPTGSMCELHCPQAKRKYCAIKNCSLVICDEHPQNEVCKEHCPTAGKHCTTMGCTAPVCGRDKHDSCELHCFMCVCSYEGCDETSCEEHSLGLPRCVLHCTRTPTRHCCKLGCSGPANDTTNFCEKHSVEY